jgi:DNA-binding MarR family transcriptional regulator
MWCSFVELSEEVRLVFHSLSRLAEAAHAGRGINPPMRAVLEYLHRSGEATVPQIAQARGVSRQHIQTTMNHLSDREMVAVRSNPAHRRSGLYHLTEAGEKSMSEILDAEEGLCAEALRDLDQSDLAVAAQTLSAVRQRLQQVTHDLEKQ